MAGAPANPMAYDVVLGLEGWVAGLVRHKIIPPGDLVVHSLAATNAGAVVSAMGKLRGAERNHLIDVTVQQCPGGARCLYDAAKPASDGPG